MGWLSIKNWRRFQHYRDRRPDWVKLYIDLLDDADFTQLSKNAQLVYFKVILVAAKKDNAFPNNPGWIGLEISLPASLVKRAIGELTAAGFLIASQVRHPDRTEGWASRYIPKETRERLIRESGYACAACGSLEGLEINYILPISAGGTGDESNLQVLCRSCNRRKRTQRSGGAPQMRSEPAPDVRSASRAPARSQEKETEKDIDPPAPAKRGSPSPRQQGTNPRAAGTNPRANGQADAHRQALEQWVDRVAHHYDEHAFTADLHDRCTDPNLRTELTDRYHDRRRSEAKA